MGDFNKNAMSEKMEEWADYKKHKVIKNDTEYKSCLKAIREYFLTVPDFDLEDWKEKTRKLQSIVEWETRHGIWPKK